MVLLLRFAKPTRLILLASGAIAHNLGQLAAASVLLGSGLALAYAPVLLISGLIMGWLTSLSLSAVIPALEKVGLGRDLPPE